MLQCREIRRRSTFVTKKQSSPPPLPSRISLGLLEFPLNKHTKAIPFPRTQPKLPPLYISILFPLTFFHELFSVWPSAGGTCLVSDCQPRALSYAPPPSPFPHTPTHPLPRPQQKKTKLLKPMKKLLCSLFFILSFHPFFLLQNPPHPHTPNSFFFGHHSRATPAFSLRSLLFSCVPSSLPQRTSLQRYKSDP